MSAPAAPELLFPTCAECAGIGFTGIQDWLWDMEEDIGAGPFRAFLARHAGHELSLSRAPLPGEAPELVPAYAWLRDRFGPGRLMVPIGPAAHRARLAWTVFKLLDAGSSLASVARATGTSTRNILRHKTRLIQFGALKAPRPTPQRNPR